MRQRKYSVGLTIQMLGGCGGTVKFLDFRQNNFYDFDCCNSLFLRNDGHWNKKTTEFIWVNAISKQTFPKFVVANEGLL